MTIAIELMRKDALATFTHDMFNKMIEALEKDPSRSAVPWNDYTRKFLRSRLIGEFHEWYDTARKLEGRQIYEHITTEDPEYQKGFNHQDITLILAEMQEILDVANFCFFQYTKLNTILKELDK